MNITECGRFTLMLVLGKHRRRPTGGSGALTPKSTWTSRSSEIKRQLEHLDKHKSTTVLQKMAALTADQQVQSVALTTSFIPPPESSATEYYNKSERSVSEEDNPGYCRLRLSGSNTSIRTYDTGAA